MVRENETAGGSAAHCGPNNEKYAKLNDTLERKGRKCQIIAYIGDLFIAVKEIPQNAIVPEKFSDVTGTTCQRPCDNYIDYEAAVNINIYGDSLGINSQKKHNFASFMNKKNRSPANIRNIELQIQKSTYIITIEVFECEAVLFYRLHVNEKFLHVLANETKCVQNSTIYRVLNDKSICDLCSLLNTIFKSESTTYHRLFGNDKVLVFGMGMFEKIAGEILSYTLKTPSVDFYKLKKHQLSSMIDQTMVNILNCLFIVENMNSWCESIKTKRLCRILAGLLLLKEGFSQEGTNQKNMHKCLLELLFDCKNFIIREEK